MLSINKPKLISLFATLFLLIFSLSIAARPDHSDRHDSRGHSGTISRHNHSSGNYGAKSNYNHSRRHHRTPDHYKFGFGVAFSPYSYLAFTSGRSYFYYGAGFNYRPYGSPYVIARPPLGSIVYSLPFGYRTFYIGGHTHYVYNDTYYIRDNRDKYYVVVDQPAAVANSTELYVYPMAGQTADQTARDRYECYLWAVNETGFDPGRATGEGDSGNADEYRRASTACLEARKYSVK